MAHFVCTWEICPTQRRWDTWRNCSAAKASHGTSKLTDDIVKLFLPKISSLNIDMSTDPFTGRNPSYCFVDFRTTEDAQRALETMQGHYVLGSPVKLNYCTPRKPVQNRKDELYAFNRWERAEEAPSRWLAPHEEGRRLWVGGLHFLRLPQHVVNKQIRGFFDGWPVQVVSKVVSSNPPRAGMPQYCFVDLETATAARQAVLALNNTAGSDGTIYQVQLANRSLPRKVIREQDLDNDITAGRAAQTLRTRNLLGDWRIPQY